MTKIFPDRGSIIPLTLLAPHRAVLLGSYDQAIQSVAAMGKTLGVEGSGMPS